MRKFFGRRVWLFYILHVHVRGPGADDGSFSYPISDVGARSRLRHAPD